MEEICYQDLIVCIHGHPFGEIELGSFRENQTISTFDIKNNVRKTNADIIDAPHHPTSILEYLFSPPYKTVGRLRWI